MVGDDPWQSNTMDSESSVSSRRTAPPYALDNPKLEQPWVCARRLLSAGSRRPTHKTVTFSFACSSFSSILVFFRLRAFRLMSRAKSRPLSCRATEKTTDVERRPSFGSSLVRQWLVGTSSLAYPSDIFSRLLKRKRKKHVAQQKSSSTGPGQREVDGVVAPSMICGYHRMHKWVPSARNRTAALFGTRNSGEPFGVEVVAASRNSLLAFLLKAQSSEARALLTTFKFGWCRQRG